MQIAWAFASRIFTILDENARLATTILHEDLFIILSMNEELRRSNSCDQRLKIYRFEENCVMDALFV